VFSSAGRLSWFFVCFGFLGINTEFQGKKKQHEIEKLFQ
jgi:hypothetical protein